MKEIKIDIPNEYEIDKKNSTFERIIFKKKENTKPRSWKEYCIKQVANNKSGYYINDGDCCFNKISWDGCSRVNHWRNVLPSKELAEAFLAMMQLISLRQAWVDNWEPNYYMNMASNWGIEYEPNLGVFSIENHCRTSGGGLTFPTKEIAEDFINCFKDLLEVAKPLI